MRPIGPARQSAFFGTRLVFKLSRAARGFVLFLLAFTAQQRTLVGATLSNEPAETLPTFEETTVKARSTLELHVIGSESQLQSLQQFVGTTQLGSVELKWHKTAHFAPQELLLPMPHLTGNIGCWIDLRKKTQAHLYFVVPAYDRFMLRDFALDKGLDNYALTAIAEIIELSVDALLADADAGLSRKDARELLLEEQPLPPQLPPQKLHEKASSRVPPKAQLSWGLGLSYQGLGGTSRLKASHGPGALFFLERTSQNHFEHLALDVTYAPNRRVNSELLDYSAGRIDFGLSLSERWFPWASKRFSVGPQLRFGLSRWSVTPSEGDLPGSYRIASKRTEYDPNIELGAAFRLSADANFCAELVPLVRVNVSPIRYELLVNDKPTTISQEPRIHPGVQLRVLVH